MFSETYDVSEEVEYPDDFEEAEVEEEYEDEAARVHTDAPQQPHDDGVEEEFQLCDAGGLTVTLKALKEKGWLKKDAIIATYRSEGIFFMLSWLTLTGKINTEASSKVYKCKHRFRCIQEA